MARELNGAELAGFIKERQARQVRALRQAHHIYPKLAIIKSDDASDVINTYIRMKQRYAEDILIETEVHTTPVSGMKQLLATLNQDDTIHGIIVQLPIGTREETDEIVNAIDPTKDVDGLGVNARFVSATAMAINWLLAGYNIDLARKKIAVIGSGRLVGAPLTAMWTTSGYAVKTITKSDDLRQKLRTFDVIVSGTGVAHLLKADMIPVGAVVVDAGTTSEDGVIVGDVDESVRSRDDVQLTPEKGGVGPLTIAALFDGVIQAATARIGEAPL